MKAFSAIIRRLAHEPAPVLRQIPPNAPLIRYPRSSKTAVQQRYRANREPALSGESRYLIILYQRRDRLPRVDSIMDIPDPRVNIRIG